MYAPYMRTCFPDVLAAVSAAWILAACQTASPQAAAPVPEAEQVIGSTLKDLYMSASLAPQHSAQQQKLILSMAQKASNGKELLMVMRAAMGVFPAGAVASDRNVEGQVQSIVTGKMMQCATLEQMIDYAGAYPVDPEQAHRFVERMFGLSDDNSDARIWYRIKATAVRLGVKDLGQQAQARVDRLAPQ